MALRLAREVDLRSSQIEGTAQSWAAIVPGILASEQKSALKEFHGQTVDPKKPVIMITFTNEL